MEQIPPPKEVKILETAEDIQERREQVRERPKCVYIDIYFNTRYMFLFKHIF